MGQQNRAWAAVQPYRPSEAPPKPWLRCLWTLQVEPDIFNIVDPGTNIQCTWNSLVVKVPPWQCPR